jgi:hypothetical protein
MPADLPPDIDLRNPIISTIQVPDLGWWTAKRVEGVLRNNWLKWNEKENKLIIGINSWYEKPIKIPECGRYYTLWFSDRDSLLDSIIDTASKCLGSQITRASLETLAATLRRDIRALENPSRDAIFDMIISTLRSDRSVWTSELTRFIAWLQLQWRDQALERFLSSLPIASLDDTIKNFIWWFIQVGDNRNTALDTLREIQRIRSTNPQSEIQSNANIIGDQTRRDVAYIERFLLAELKRYKIQYWSDKNPEKILTLIGDKLGIDIGFVSIGWRRWAWAAMIIHMANGEYALISENRISVWPNLSILLDIQSIRSGVVIRHYIANSRGDIIMERETPLTSYLMPRVNTPEDIRSYVLNPRTLPDGVSIKLKITNLEKEIILRNTISQTWYRELWLSRKDIYGMVVDVMSVRWWVHTDRGYISIQWSVIKTPIGPDQKVIAIDAWVRWPWVQIWDIWLYSWISANTFVQGSQRGWHKPQTLGLTGRWFVGAKFNTWNRNYYYTEIYNQGNLASRSLWSWSEKDIIHFNRWTWFYLEWSTYNTKLSIDLLKQQYGRSISTVLLQKEVSEKANLTLAWRKVSSSSVFGWDSYIYSLWINSITGNIKWNSSLWTSNASGVRQSGASLWIRLDE